MASSFERLAQLQTEIPAARQAFNATREALGTLLPRNPSAEDHLERIIKHAEQFGPETTAAEIQAHPQKFGWSHKAPGRAYILPLLVTVAQQGKQLSRLLNEQRVRQAAQDRVLADLSRSASSPRKVRTRDRDR